MTTAPNGKVPPFVKDANNSHKVSNRGMLSGICLLVSLLSLAIAMIAGAKLAFDVFSSGFQNTLDNGLAGLGAKLVAVGLAYAIGWGVALFGIHALGNLVLPIFIKAYGWLTLAGICLLYIMIINKLFAQAYSLPKFIAFCIMLLAGMLALLGLHLLIEDHSLVPFAFPLFIISLVHLFLIVYHYVFMDAVEYGYIWGDAAIFLGMGILSTLMLAHLGLLNGLRQRIDRIFKRVNGHLTPIS